MEWRVSKGLVDYAEALALMDQRVAAIQAGDAEELTWLLEHPPLYTLGTSAKETDVLDSTLPHYATGRGGQVTYHGPGQRVVYVLRDLKRHAGAAGPDLRQYVKNLEYWVIATLGEFGIEGFLREGRVGVWVDAAKGGQAPFQMKPSEAKIAALGVRIQKWVTSHGIALNVHPDLSHYAGIVPCGIREYGVTSLRDLGVTATMDQVDAALKHHFERTFS